MGRISVADRAVTMYERQGWRAQLRRGRAIGRRAVRWGLAAALASAPVSAGSGVVRQIAELVTEQYASSCEAETLSTWNDRAFLALGGNCGGAEPWLSDGTTEGTLPIRDLIPGDAGSDPVAIGSAGSLLYFTAALPGMGRELWRTDGTPEGTVLLGDLEPGPRSSEPMPLGELDGAFLFSATTALSGRELWRTDGTAAGTSLVRDILPGPESGLPEPTSGDPGPFAAAIGGLLLFAAQEEDHGLELWRTDGTAGGTSLVLDLDPGPAGSGPGGFWTGPGGIYLGATRADLGAELWLSDGTAGGTRLLGDIAAGASSSDPVALGAAEGLFLFAAWEPAHGRELWRSDGTQEGTVLWRDIVPGVGSSSPMRGATLEGVTVFAADDGVHGFEPWRSDGTPEGTYLLADLRPGGPYDDSWYGGATANDSWIFFAASSGDETISVVRTNGTPAGTQMGAPLGGDYITRIMGPAAAGDHGVLTVCTDSCGPCYEYCGTYTSDGTSTSTTTLWPILVHEDAAPGRFRPRSTDAVFTALRYSRLYRTDGTAGGTVPFERGGRFAYVRTELTPLPDGEVLFAAPAEGSNAYLWRTAADSFNLVLGFNWWSSTVAGQQILPLGSQYLFSVVHGDSAAELWRTDGTAAGTHEVSGFDRENFWCSFPRDLVAIGGTAWFFADDAATGCELWESDGTPEGTLLHELTPGPEPLDEAPTQLTPALLPDGPALFYLTGIWPWQNEDRLWRWDPQTEIADLVRLLEMDPWPGEGRFVLVPAADRVLFFDLLGGESCALFSTDGTPEGTVPVLNVGTGLRGIGTCPDELVRLRGEHYFTACSPSAGCELWRTDGSPAGTVQFVEIEPGVISSSPSSLAVIGGRLFFSACTSEHGCEPWASDGTATGTWQIGDLFPGPGSSNPTAFAGVHGDVFFAADGGTGSEPWIFEPDPLFADGFESGDTTRWTSTVP